jgi:hypothetical protein
MLCVQECSYGEEFLLMNGKDSSAIVGRKYVIIYYFKYEGRKRRKGKKTCTSQ